MSDGDLDQAEEELNQARAQRFPAGPAGAKSAGRRIPQARREMDRRGTNERTISAQMQDALKHADRDLAHAQELYNSVAPFLNGVQLAEKVSLERDKAAKKLAAAQQAQLPQPVAIRRRKSMSGEALLMAVTRSSIETRDANSAQRPQSGKFGSRTRIGLAADRGDDCLRGLVAGVSAKIPPRHIIPRRRSISLESIARQVCIPCWPSSRVPATANSRPEQIFDSLADSEGSFSEHGRPRAHPRCARATFWRTANSRNCGRARKTRRPIPSLCSPPPSSRRSSRRFRARHRRVPARFSALGRRDSGAVFSHDPDRWTVRGFNGPWVFLPLLLILTGIGFALMVALRDPLRDTLIFIPFAQGVAGGCIVMLIASLIDWETATPAYSFVPLLGAIVLSIALIFSAADLPGSDARVNLGPFQPVEAIKILLVFFLAGYFAKRWPLLRELREKRLRIPGIELPRLEYTAAGVNRRWRGALFFYLQKDLGPALVFACVFLTLYAIARNRVGLAASGLAALLGGFLVGYFLGTPKTVHDRVAMWLSPWSNTVRGGDQVVHSLLGDGVGRSRWGRAPGLAKADVIPAGYTDLIVSVLGEDWGFAGLAVVYRIFAS